MIPFLITIQGFPCDQEVYQLSRPRSHNQFHTFSTNPSETGSTKSVRHLHCLATKERITDYVSWNRMPVPVS